MSGFDIKNGAIPELFTTAERDLLTPEEGVVINNSDKSCLERYNGAVWVELCGSIYGSIGVYGNATADTSNVTPGVYNQITRFDTNGLSSNTTPDHTNDHITIDVTGDYEILFYCSFSGATGRTYSITAHKNNGATILPLVHTTRKLGATDVGSCSGGFQYNLEAGDTLELWYNCDGISQTVTFQDVTLSCARL